MKKRVLLFLYLAGLLICCIPAYFEKSPGYMDADYYFSVALRLKQGFGFNEMVIWNYLDDPAGLPHPSNAYWMPLTSMIGWVGMLITGSSGFSTSRVIFIFLSALIPPLTAQLSFRLTNKESFAILAGLLAIFPGFYLPYLVTTDSFAICMVLGAGYLLLFDRFARADSRRTILFTCFAMGAITGLLHLSRTEGFIYLIIGAIAILLTGRSSHFDRKASWIFFNISVYLVGYLLVMGPWMIRNLVVFGTPLSPGGIKTLWLTEYNQLFAYPGSLVNFNNWLQSGAWNIVRDRFSALNQNLQTGIIVQGGIFLLPLVVLGLLKLRAHPVVRIGCAVWLVTFLLMTFIFPYAGPRGGFFHSGAIMQPLWWAVAPVGLDTFIQWGAVRRSWNFRQAGWIFSSALICLTILLSLFVSYRRLIGGNIYAAAWNESADRYRQVEEGLSSLGARPGKVVMVNNAPGFYAQTGRPAISIPAGYRQAIIGAATQFQADYLILEFEQVEDGSGLFSHPGDRPGLSYLGTVAGARIYTIDKP
jgi:hypothetical protein